MKCEYVQLFINELADNQLTDSQKAPLEEHVAQCQLCKARLQEIITLKNQLASLHFADKISDQFIQHAIVTAEHQPILKNKSHFTPFKASYFAIAASFLIFFSLSFFIFNPTDNRSESINLLSQQQLNLLFDAPKALESVTFTVILPDNVEMQGFPGLKQVTWQGSIKQGKNLLSIPIIHNNNNQGVIITELQHNDTRRIFKVNVQTDNSFKHVT